jgi:two-component system copper resistance phosphate regulon response regulator CusR
MQFSFSKDEETKSMRILLVEDDLPLSSFLKKGLHAENYVVDVSSDGDEALALALEYDYDLAILDVGLPGKDGFQVLKDLRERKQSMPVLLLTGRAEVSDRVKGLNAGADDYLTKPFAFGELCARVRALLRRPARPQSSVLRFANLELDRIRHTVARGGQRIDLTQKEFALLEYLMLNAGRRVSRAMIIEHVWNLSFDSMTNVVDVYINYLRRKIDTDSDLKLIRTIRGVGYQLGDELPRAA